MRVTRRAALKSLVATGVGAVAGTGAYGYVYERHDLEVTRATVPVVGLRIGLLTDVHRSQWVSHDDVIHAVARLMDERPDLIILGGDYVTWGGGSHHEYVPLSADALQPLSARYGVFGI